MKVVFLEDVPNVARAGDIKEVAHGYGRNFLIPRKLALLYNAQAINLMETQRRMRARQQAESEADLLELSRQLAGKEITLQAKVGAKDHLYGSITSADIAAELESTTGIVVDKRKIELAEPIRQLGSHEIAIRLAKDVIPKVKVTVTEKETEKKTKKKIEKKAEKKAEKKIEKKTEKKTEKETD